MQNSFNKPHKVKKILVRYNCCQQTLPGTTFQHPEKSYLLKYSPKYYNTLTLEVSHEHPLQSKIKRIKKLKKFTGHFRGSPSLNLWSNLLRNTRKDLEEIPLIIPISSINGSDQLFWARLMLWKMRFFPNITRVLLPRRKANYEIQDYDDTLLVKKSFMGYLRNMRKLKTLEISKNEASSEEEKWMQEKLNGMNQLLGRLETIKMNIVNWGGNNIPELFKNKNLASYMTSLTFPSTLKSFDLSFLMIPQMCKSLKFLSIGFDGSMDGNREFLEFLASLQILSSLLSLDFGFPRDVKYYWSYFKPQSSLQYLKLRLDLSDMVKSGLLETEPLLGHWDDIEELDELEFSMSRVFIDHMSFARSFITQILKKVKRLCSFKCSIETFGNTLRSSLRGEPLLVEEVPHLYKSLQKFEYTFKNSGDGKHLEFDMKTMKVLRNLKEFKLHANGLDSGNLEEMVDLLQKNQKEGDFSTLTFKSQSIDSIYWFRDTMEKISQVKKIDQNFKIFMDLDFRIQPRNGKDLEILENLLNILQSFGEIKGLFVGVNLFGSYWSVPVGDFEDMMRKYIGLRNLVVKVGHWAYKNFAGEKEQFIHPKSFL